MSEQVAILIVFAALNGWTGFTAFTIVDYVRGDDWHMRWMMAAPSKVFLIFVLEFWPLLLLVKLGLYLARRR